MSRSRFVYLTAGSLMVLVVLAVAVLAPYLAPVDPYYMDSKTLVMDGSPPYAPSPLHPLGTDELGRDVWTRVAFGTRWSLWIAFLVLAGRLALAVPMSVAAALGHRSVGWLVGRLYVYTSAVPPLVIYLFLLTAPTLRLAGVTPSIAITVAVLTLVEWPRLALVLKGRLEELSTEQFVEGAVAVGATPWRIFWVHLVPHLWPTLIHLAVAEMGRALLVIAQLGIFNVWVGGGIMLLVDDMTGREIYKIVTGVPEWGTLLADSRRFITTAPWIPLAPAFAFLFAVTGFNILSQGLERAVISFDRLREATTGRVSRRWRWALPAALLAGVIWFYGGTPWGRTAGIQALAREQAAALTSGSLDGFLSTLAEADPAYRERQRLWASQVTQSGSRVTITPKGRIRLFGHQAVVDWTVSLGPNSDQPAAFSRSARLERRWGRWYEVGEGLQTVRGYHVDMAASFDPVAPFAEQARLRWYVYYLASSLDHAYQGVAPVLGLDSRDRQRPQVALYPDHVSFETAVAGRIPEVVLTEKLFDTAYVPWYVLQARAENPSRPWSIPIGAGPGTVSTVSIAAGSRTSASRYDATIAWTPGDSIRISPQFVRRFGLDRQKIEQALGFLLIPYLVHERGGSESGLALYTGLLDLRQREGEPFPVNLDQMVGAPLLPLPQLLAARIEDLAPSKQDAYVAQSALLVEYLRKSLSDEEISRAAESRDPLFQLAQAAGVPAAQLRQGYEDYLLARITDMSVLKMEAGRARIPLSLTDAVEERTAAALSGDEVRFLSMADQDSKKAQSEWLQYATGKGLKRYDSTVLDMVITEQRVGYAHLYVLERLEMADGTVASGVVEQIWVKQAEQWRVATEPARS